MINYTVTILGILWVLRLERRGAICRKLLENENLSIRSAADDLFPARAAGRWLPS
jgi:hypothetical protein